MNPTTTTTPSNRSFSGLLQDRKLSPEKLAKLRQLMPEEIDAYEAEKPVNKALAEFITEDKDMIAVKAKVKILSEVDDPVLIRGETGTGKELLACALHGDRKPEQLITVNCAGIPELLVESELFGHKKGSFTGAVNDKVGLLRAAFDGTIFLDEIGDLPLSAQAKLLRAIQEKKIRRVGDETGEEQINCRFVCATHRNLKMMVAEGTFREDLYWRIRVVPLETKPIRERTVDIPLIVKHLIIKERNKINHDIEDYQEFSKALVANRDKLTGNIRQIQSIVRNYHLFGELPTFE